MKSIFTFCLLSVGTLLLFSSPASGQHPFVQEKRDYVWLLGYDSNPDNLDFGGTRIDFSSAPPSVTYEYRTLDFDITNAAICDTAGQLLFYTNGIAVHDANHELVLNGDGLNPDPYTQFWVNNGYNLYQGAIFLPTPESYVDYHLLHTERTGNIQIEGNNTVVHRLYESIVTIPENASPYVGIKNHPVVQDTLEYGKMTSARHGNGQDWWVLSQEYDSNRFYRLFLTKDGLNIDGNQQIGELLPSGLGQAKFSPDGNKYASFTIHNLETGQFLNIYSFDRCTGALYDPLQINYNDTAGVGGIAISPNSRFLYVSSFRYIYQYDLEADDVEASREVVAVYDGFADPYPFSTYFFLCQLAPDNKIYISAPGGTSYLHIIHNPNAKGVACGIEQHGLSLPTYNAFGIPNFPYYGLGPLDGSPCDTLGLDHHPDAAFRFRLDSIAERQVSFWDYSAFFPSQWAWDFGDNSPTSNQRDPVHTYSSNGLYKVCLTVSNAYNSDTSCEWVQVGTPNNTRSPEKEEHKLLSVFPNPVSEVLTVLPLQPLSESMYWQIVNTDGQIVKEGQLPSGQAQLWIDMKEFAVGVYLFRLRQPDGFWYAERIVKQ